VDTKTDLTLLARADSCGDVHGALCMMPGGAEAARWVADQGGSVESSIPGNLIQELLLLAPSVGHGLRASEAPTAVCITGQEGPDHGPAVSGRLRGMTGRGLAACQHPSGSANQPPSILRTCFRGGERDAQFGTRAHGSVPP